MKSVAIVLSGLVFLGLSFFVSNGGASDAYVFAEEEFGQGFFRSRGSECFFITAAHVVEEAVDAELTTSDRRILASQMIIKYPSDVAILKVDISDTGKCPKGSWGDGSKLKSLLSVYQKGIVKTKLSDGSTIQTDVDITSYDDFGYILVEPSDSTVKFAKGFSGSPFYIAGETAGMLLSVDDGIGRVFRQDALNHTVALFFGDEKQEPKSPQPGKIRIDEPHVTKEVKPTESLDLPKSFSGKLSKDQILTYQFPGKSNSPVKIDIAKPTNDLGYNFRIINSQDIQVFNPVGVFRRNYQLPFTPLEDDTYTMELKGTNHFGEYKLTIRQLALDADLTSQANVIVVGETVKGTLAQNAVARYKYKGSANSPVKIDIAKPTNDLGYNFRIINSQDIQVFNPVGVFRRNYQLPFTPLKDDTYTIELKGTNHFGEYKLTARQLALDADLTSQANVIVVGETVKGTLAQNAVARYKYKGSANSPVTFDIPKPTNKLAYNFRIINSQDKQVFNPVNIYSSKLQLPFTPLKDDTYTIELKGTNHFGEYKLTVRQLALDADLTGQANVLVVGETMKGTLAYNAVARYKFKGSANSPVMFDIPKPTNKLAYNLRVMNSQEKEVFKPVNIYSRNLQLPFTPLEDDTYTIELKGTNHFGEYKLTVRQLALDADLTGQANVLVVGETMKGTLAYNAVARYKFKGSANSPVMFDIPKPTNKLAYNLRVMNSQEKEVFKPVNIYSRNLQLPFTPLEDDTYTIELKGTNHFGEYKLTVRQLALDADLTGQANVIVVGETMKGTLAYNAVARYKFKGSVNSPVMFDIPKPTNKLAYNLRVMNSQEKEVFKPVNIYSRNLQLPFTPLEDDTYTIELKGTNHFGEYKLTVRQLALDADLTGQANVLVVGETMKGTLAYNAVARYKFKGSANSPVMFDIPKPTNKLAYNLRVMNSQEKEVFKPVNIYSRNLQLPFTPLEDDTYTIELKGTNHFGEYIVTIKN